ncbi:MAG: bifunctional sugar-1-phosphate nucleotidylyltransferase/acetyltransferase [candidate division KSB1 bacterium]|nr:bifunctional sugar-1-phosphate nucleotidylyltransferase/acetyltransferase [candidate division KSB1 bacterium]
MQAVLMVAGKSTRTYPLTLTRPKPLLPLLNKAIIRHSLDQIAGLFDEVILITGYKQDMIKKTLGDSYRDMHLIYQEQTEQLGTGHAVLQAKAHINGKFVAMNGDDLFSRADFEQLLEYDNAALVKRVEDPSLYGVFQTDSSHKVLNLVEKPQTYLGDLANIGCYIFQPEIFTVLESTPMSERGEIEITSAVLETAKNKDFYALPIAGDWLPTGYPWHLLDHQEHLMAELESDTRSGIIEDGVTIKGNVQIGEGSIIKSGCYLEGPIIIGAGSVIDPHCHIGRYSVIGDNCRIGHATEIRHSLIMNDSQIGHLSFIADSIVGSNCLIGSGSMTANMRFDDETVHSEIKGKPVDSKRKYLGAVFSDSVRAGIHTSFYPGVKIDPGQTIDPGSVVVTDVKT